MRRAQESLVQLLGQRCRSIVSNLWYSEALPMKGLWLAELAQSSIPDPGGFAGLVESLDAVGVRTVTFCGWRGPSTGDL